MITSNYFQLAHLFFFHRNWSINYELHLIGQATQNGKQVQLCDTSDTSSAFLV